MELAHPDLNNKLDSYQKITYSDIYTFLKNIDFEQEEFPVSEFNYMYYALLTEVIANQQNEDYFSLLEKNIIEPLKLTHTQYLDDFKAEELSPVFDKTDETERLRFDALKESTELQSSLEDMISFTRQQLLFAENSLQKGMTLTRDLSSFDERDQAVGLAWQSEMTEGMVYYYIQGNTPGSSAFVTIIPDIKSALIVLSNTPLDTQNFSKTILNQMIQE
ncbi:MAG TPA: serine hydrolase domain-containing protein, partial [Chitinophagaceae bacterium]|nr:serine hydrolase domain-containing protein [Chitinophagaceae bacterium]